MPETNEPQYRRCTPEEEREIQDALGLVRIHLNINKSAYERYKQLAIERDVYAPEVVMRELLNNYVADMP